MKRFTFIAAVALLALGACARLPAVVPTAVPPSATALPVSPTATLAPPSATPTATAVPPSPTPPSPSATPAPTQTSRPTPTTMGMTDQHPNGIYTVYRDIAPGVWCPVNPNPQCYWAVLYPGGDYYQEGTGRGCLTISQVVEMAAWDPICGPMKYLHPMGYMAPLDKLPLSDKELKAPHGPGDYLVGKHIAAGVWQVEGKKACAWTIYDRDSNAIVDNVGATGVLNLIGRAHWLRLGEECAQLTYLHN